MNIVEFLSETSRSCAHLHSGKHWKILTLVADSHDVLKALHEHHVAKVECLRIFASDTAGVVRQYFDAIDSSPGLLPGVVEFGDVDAAALEEIKAAFAAHSYDIHATPDCYIARHVRPAPVITTYPPEAATT